MKRKGFAYQKTIDLYHHEQAAKVDLITGEVTVVNSPKNNLPDGKKPFGREEIGWRKSFDHSWDYLDSVLSDLELRVVGKLCRMAKMNTNSLEPLDDDTTQLEIAKHFSIDRRRAAIVFQKLYDFGIYAKFQVAREDAPYTKYWILNPYLSFGGALIQSDISELFRGTKLTNEYYRRLELKSTN